MTTNEELLKIAADAASQAVADPADANNKARADAAARLRSLRRALRNGGLSPSHERELLREATALHHAWGFKDHEVDIDRCHRVTPSELAAATPTTPAKASHPPPNGPLCDDPTCVTCGPQRDRPLRPTETTPTTPTTEPRIRWQLVNQSPPTWGREIRHKQWDNADRVHRHVLVGVLLRNESNALVFIPGVTLEEVTG